MVVVFLFGGWINVLDGGVNVIMCWLDSGLLGLN